MDAPRGVERQLLTLNPSYACCRYPFHLIVSYLTLTLCQTNPTSGACLATPSPNVVTTIAVEATPTFGIFVAGHGAAVPNLPAINRVFVRFTDAGGALRGETSVAVRTQ